MSVIYGACACFQRVGLSGEAGWSLSTPRRTRYAHLELCPKADLEDADNVVIATGTSVVCPATVDGDSRVPRGNGRDLLVSADNREPLARRVVWQGLRTKRVRVQNPLELLYVRMVLAALRVDRA